MDEDQLYVVAPLHTPPRRVPDTVSGEWLAERLAELPTRKQMYRAVLLGTTAGSLPRAVSRMDLPLGVRAYRR